MTEEIECPRCGNVTSIEIEDIEDGSLNTDCENCGASLEVSYTVSIDITDVCIDEVPPISFECPECDYSLEISEISDESGSEEVVCENCQSVLEVSWYNWGEDINVEVLKKGEEDADDTDDADDVDDVDDADDDEY